MLYRSLIALALLVMTCSGLSAADSEMGYKELLREDFSLFTAGSEERPSANPVCDNLQYIPENKTLTPGWQGVEIYQAGGMAYQSAGGRIFTPDIDLSQNGGSFRVSFRMKLASGSPEGYANVVHANISNHLGVKLSEEWQTVVFELSGGIHDDYLCIRGVSATSPEQSKVRVFIDDILVEVPAPDIETPTSVSYDNFDGSSFTAYWHPVESAEKYELQLFTYDSFNQPEYVDGSFTTTTNSYHFSELAEEWSAYYLQIRAIAGEKSSPWSSPVLIEGIATPVLKEETMVKGNNFTASWEPVNGAYKYEFNVYFCHQAAADEQFYHADTDFSFIKATEAGSQIDFGFDELPGWFFGAADLQDGYIGIQGAFAYLGYAAQIESPALNLNSSGGKISVEFKAKNDDARTGVAVALYNPHNGDFTLADSYETELSKNWYTVKASLDGGTDGSILAIIPTRSGNVYVDDLKVWQNIKTNAVGKRMALNKSLTDNFMAVSGLKCPKGDYVGYNLRAVGISADQTRWLYSAYTEMRYPNHTTSVNEIIEDYGDFAVSVDGMNINVTGIGEFDVYDLMGHKVATGQCNESTILPHPGIYIIKSGQKSAKISIR